MFAGYGQWAVETSSPVQPMKNFHTGWRMVIRANTLQKLFLWKLLLWPWHHWQWKWRVARWTILVQQVIAVPTTTCWWLLGNSRWCWCCQMKVPTTTVEDCLVTLDGVGVARWRDVGSIGRVHLSFGDVRKGRGTFLFIVEEIIVAFMNCLCIVVNAKVLFLHISFSCVSHQSLEVPSSKFLPPSASCAPLWPFCPYFLSSHFQCWCLYCLCYLLACFFLLLIQLWPLYSSGAWACPWGY